MFHSKAEMDNLFTIMCCMNCGISLVGAANINYILKFQLIISYLPKENIEKTLSMSERDFLTYCLYACLSRSFVLVQCCVLTWVTKVLMRAI